MKSLSRQTLAGFVSALLTPQTPQTVRVLYIYIYIYEILIIHIIIIIVMIIINIIVAVIIIMITIIMILIIREIIVVDAADTADGPGAAPPYYSPLLLLLV